jgi:two-component system OmpR family sensor kinase
VARTPRRGLFWRVYPTLLVSLALVAILGAAVWRLFSGAMPPPTDSLPMHMHMLGMLLAVAAVVGLAAYPVVSRLTRRLEALRLSVDAWGGGETTRRAVVDGDDEIGSVAASFNAAADRTDALLGAHKALLAHASHELRSPLTRLRLAVEMLAAGTEGELGPSIRRDIAELDALVGEILLASRLDHGGDTDIEEVIDCLALAAEEVARAGVSLADVAPGAGAFEVLGSPRLLRRLIRNLIDNALEHGSPPVEVVLTGGEPAGGFPVVIAVRDHGPGIPPTMVDRVFEPFFRPDGVGEGAGGWGLGLSLVRQIAERHGGRASCASDRGVTIFSVALPPAAAGKRAIC